MAQERTLGYASAPGREEEPSKEELQRRMEEARESISTTVTEIKDTVAHQVENVKDALDWREHFKRQPLAWSLGAAGVGFLAGYGLAAVIKGDSSERPSSMAEELYPRSDREYAIRPLLAEQAEAPSLHTNGGKKDEGPGLFERFKESSAYDRLSKEAASIGDRLVEELSSTAHLVVLPALLAKVKNWIGLDLSAKEGSAAGRTLSSGTQPSRNTQSSPGSTYEPITERPS